MKLLLSLLLIHAGFASAQCVPQANSWLTLEVVASEPAMDEAVEVIDIDSAGCASIRYASFDQRAGLYRRQLSPSEVDALATRIAQHDLAAFDAEAVRSAISQREHQFRVGLLGDGPERFVVACGDTYRLQIASAGKNTQIEWYAPKQIAQRHPEVTALNALVGLIEHLQAVAAVAGRTRIATVSP